jgi:uncharacterized SAM-binding protein YcdF (DUF218 family)
VLVRIGRQVQEMPRSLTRDIARVALVGIVASIAIALYATWRIVAQGSQDEVRPADAIVVMGAAQYDGRPSPVFRARLDHAIDLYRQGIAPILVMTGGKAEGDRTTEAATGRAYAVANGVPDSAILDEDQARTTLESIHGVGAVLRDRDLRSVVFVSDPSHMLRVLRMASDEGITGWGSPTTTSPVEADLRAKAEATAHELGALAIYFLNGESP